MMDARSQLLTIGPPKHDQAYQSILAVASRYSTVVNYGGTMTVPLYPCHPASSLSSAFSRPDVGDLLLSTIQVHLLLSQVHVTPHRPRSSFV
jgi:hypothetical protein